MPDSPRSHPAPRVDPSFQDLLATFLIEVASHISASPDPRPALLLLTETIHQLIRLLEAPLLELTPAQRRRFLAHTLRRLNFPQARIDQLLSAWHPPPTR